MIWLKIKSFANWPFEIGRRYRLENGPIVWTTDIGVGSGEASRQITVPQHYVCDLFTGVPNLRMRERLGAQVSYQPIFRRDRRTIWVSFAAVLHDWVFEWAKDDNDRWIAFDEANLIFEEILNREGWYPLGSVYSWGVKKLSLSAALWNRHDDGRPRA